MKILWLPRRAGTTVHGNIFRGCCACKGNVVPGWASSALFHMAADVT